MYVNLCAVVEIPTYMWVNQWKTKENTYLLLENHCITENQKYNFSSRSSAM